MVFLDQQFGISASAEMTHQAKMPEMNDLHADCTQQAELKWNTRWKQGLQLIMPERT